MNKAGSYKNFDEIDGGWLNELIEYCEFHANQISEQKQNELLGK